MGWRKGAEVDQELWPAEAFGGVTDEQFWDDLAAEKPLATTARTAQPDSGPRSQPDSASSVPGARSGGFAGGGVNVDEDPLTSPAYSLRPRGAVDGRSYPSSRTSSRLSREARSGGYRPDPLRSDGYRSGPAGSSGSVGTIPTPAYQSGVGSADTVSYRYPEQTYGGSIQSMNTPPYGEMYGNPVGLVGDPSRPNGTWSYGQPGGGAGDRGSRYAYPPAAGYRDPYDPRGNDRR
jgi:hypothetical protein